MSTSTPFAVAIVGRPNVGKSTLFNRLAGKRLALVDDRPGVTRDRREGEGRLGDLSFRIIDTAGLDDSDVETLEGRMRVQTDKAIDEADLILFMIDSRAGLTPLDHWFADAIRRKGRPTALIANKSEGRQGEAGAMEAFALGLGDPIAISAEHGEGMADLYQAIAEASEKRESKSVEPRERGVRPLRLAIVGRPNVGKSTLINTMIGQERLLTGPEAGLTRDSIAVPWTWKGHSFELHDTAGLRRKAKIQEKLEKLSVADAIRAIRFAEAVALLVDATQPFEKQDLQIAELIAEEGRALAIVLNKWDLIEDRGATAKMLREEADRLLPQVKGVPLVFMSGLTGQGIDALPAAILKTHDIWGRRISTAQMNRWLSDVVQRHPPPAVSGRRIKLRYMTQVKSRPPTFVVFASRPDSLPNSYSRYLVNDLRATFDMPGVPIRLALRGGGDNPFANRKTQKERR